MFNIVHVWKYSLPTFLCSPKYGTLTHVPNSGLNSFFSSYFLSFSPSTGSSVDTSWSPKLGVGVSGFSRILAEWNSSLAFHFSFFLHFYSLACDLPISFSLFAIILIFFIISQHLWLRQMEQSWKKQGAEETWILGILLLQSEHNSPFRGRHF